MTWRAYVQIAASCSGLAVLAVSQLSTVQPVIADILRIRHQRQRVYLFRPWGRRTVNPKHHYIIIHRPHPSFIHISKVSWVTSWQADNLKDWSSCRDASQWCSKIKCIADWLGDDVTGYQKVRVHLQAERAIKSNWVVRNLITPLSCSCQNILFVFKYWC